MISICGRCGQPVLVLRQVHLGTVIAVDLDEDPKARPGIQDPDLRVDLARGTWQPVSWGKRKNHKALHRPHAATCPALRQELN